MVIDCNTPFSNPPAFVQFYKDGRLLLGDGEEEGGGEGNAEILNGETLLIYDVQPENAGNYTCSASNHITNQKVMSKTYTVLKVKEPSKNEKSRLTFRPNEQYQVQVGDNITIPCIASGNPKPDIIWTRMGSTERLPSRHGCLTISGAVEKDFGSYMCEIFNGYRRYLRRTTIIVLMPPVFTKVPTVPDIYQEGESAFLHCKASGTPMPKVEWTINGLPVIPGDKYIMENGTLHIPYTKAQDEGVYQCFVSNLVGQNVTTALVKVNSTADLQGGLDDEYDWYQPSILEHLTLHPPSKPNVTQSSRNSAVLTWTVDLDPASGSDGGGGMPIQFFKIQFREFRKGVRSEWRTLDDVINARSRSFEVMVLKPDIKYRFRIVAVYANNDNMHGPLSKRFRLDRMFNLDRAPQQAPSIAQVLPLSESSLRVGWVMNKISLSSVEGYFIFIRKTGSKEGYRKITIIGQESHSYIFDDLEPGTSYEIRVEAFNLSGNSPPSRLVRKSTLTSIVSEELPLSSSNTSLILNSSTDGGATKDDDRSDTVLANEEISIYLIIAAILVGIVLVLILCCSVGSCLQKRKARKSFSNSNVAIHEKYSDTAR